LEIKLPPVNINSIENEKKLTARETPKILGLSSLNAEDSSALK